MMSTEKILRRARNFLRDIPSQIETARKDGATLVPLCKTSDEAAQTVIAKATQQDIVLVEHDKMLCARTGPKGYGKERVYRPEPSVQGPASIEERLADLERRMKALEQQRK
jgi:hypothetical protein